MNAEFRFSVIHMEAGYIREIGYDRRIDVRQTQSGCSVKT